MIVPMIKYSMLLYHQDKDSFMSKLMDLGLVQVHGFAVEEDERTGDLTSTIRETEEAIKRFKRRKIKIPTRSPGNGREFPSLSEIANMERELEHAMHEAEALAIEIRLLEPWGDFSREDIRKLEEQSGIEVKFFQYPESRFEDSWHKDYALQIINTINGIHFFIIFRKPEQELPISPVALPSESLGTLKAQREQCLSATSRLNQQLDECAANLTDGLHYRLSEAKDQLNLHIASLKARIVHEQTLWIVEAWCPRPSENNLVKFLNEGSIVYTTHLPSADEKPPVLLKNNWFSRLFEPIGALFSLPRYSELDLTAFFAPFFLLFFGLCLGDVGYGIIILVLTTFLKVRKNAQYKNYLTLGQLFGGSTIVAGFVSGTFFGVEMAHHDAFSQWSRFFLNQDQLFNLALVIGFVQIIFGLGINAYKRLLLQGFTHALSRIGWIVLLTCLADLYVAEVAVPITKMLLWPGLAMIVFFGAPEKGWFYSAGIGLADLYNITGILGDLLSYIRLFALGVSSAILGLVVNSIALSARDVPYVGFLLFALVLIVGHTANLLLSSLSAFVHPMRLTFVEFYKNSGFEGGGVPFAPLSRENSKQSN